RTGMNIVVISLNPDMRVRLEEIVSAAGFLSISVADIQTAIVSVSPEKPSLMLVDLDSDKADLPALRRLKRVLSQSKLIGLSVQNYHPHLKEAVQSGIFTALVKAPFEEELTYWINSLMACPESFESVSALSGQTNS
ncbi:MAG: hypothetical protein AB7V04_03225, partial [Desulfomonilaceae bacterium]